MLLLKKEVAWIQPPTVKGQTEVPTMSFAEILEVAKSVDEAGIDSWDDIERLDIRPAKRVTKIRSVENWEVQIDHGTGDVTSVAFRRSDIIESIHDGSFFHYGVKLGAFLPAGLILLVLWLSGMYLFFHPYLVKWKRRRKNATR